jgi:hypothetical protein
MIQNLMTALDEAAAAAKAYLDQTMKYLGAPDNMCDCYIAIHLSKEFGKDNYVVSLTAANDGAEPGGFTPIEGTLAEVTAAVIEERDNLRAAFPQSPLESLVDILGV